MVSFRNFFAICAMMAVLFFMFPFFQVVKESENPYDQNEYAKAAALSGAGRWAASETEPPEILFLGEGGTEMANVIEQWCCYTKRSMAYADSPEQMQELMKEGTPEILLIDGLMLRLPQQEEALAGLADSGVTIVFLRIPFVTDIRASAELRDMLGISLVASSAKTVEGIQLFPGFLLGGGVTYKIFHEGDEELQDLELEMPWYKLGRGTKVYMTGLLDEKLEEREDFPPVMWRNNYKGTFVYAVNGPYMTHVSGIGFLDSFVYEMQDYALYPVVNAQNVSVTNYPGLADENSDKIKELYSRSPSAFQQDVMWPGMAAVADTYGRKLTCFFMTQFDYRDEEEPSEKDLVFLLQQLKEIDGEAGQSFDHAGGVTVAEKMARDQTFWNQSGIPYQFSAFYAGYMVDYDEKVLLDGGRLPDVRTVVTSYRRGDSMIGYYNDNITVQCLTADANEYTYSTDLYRRCLETALGYSNWLMDMRPALWPQTDEDRWEKYFDHLASNVGSYWGLRNSFDSTTLTESDGRVRSLLNLTYDHSRQGNTITIDIENVGEAWFLLRTHGETVEDMQGGEYRMLEKDAYLLHTTEAAVQIRLEGTTGQTDFLF